MNCVAQCPAAVLGRPRNALGDVEDAAVDSVGLGRGTHPGARLGSVGGFGTGQQDAADPGASRAGGQHGGETAGGGDAASREHRDLDRIKDALQQGQGGDHIRAVAAGLGAAGHHDIHTVVGGGPRGVDVTDLGGDLDPGRAGGPPTARNRRS